METALRQYMRRSCANCHTTGEHQHVRVLSVDAAEYRPGYQCATCATVQLLPLPVRCNHCDAVESADTVIEDGVCRTCAAELRAADADAAHDRRVDEQLDERLGK